MSAISELGQVPLATWESCQRTRNKMLRILQLIEPQEIVLIPLLSQLSDAFRWLLEQQADASVELYHRSPPPWETRKSELLIRLQAETFSTPLPDHLIQVLHNNSLSINIRDTVRRPDYSISVPFQHTPDPALLATIKEIFTEPSRDELLKAIELENIVQKSLVIEVQSLLQEKNKSFEELSEARARVMQELEIARALQIAILPDSFPATSGLLGAARIQPATTMAGDFYDFVTLPDKRIGIVIADVSGKGVPAAFFMAVSRTNLRNFAYEFLSPGACLARTNNVLCTQNPTLLFVTVFYCIYDPSNGTLDYANGGHNPPYIRHADGLVEKLDGSSGLVLGVLPEIDFPEHRIQLSPGDTLVLFTDGLTEAFNSAHEAYGEESLVEVIKCSESASETMLEAIFTDVAQFAGEAPQSDDITVAVLEFIGEDNFSSIPL